MKWVDYENDGQGSEKIARLLFGAALFDLCVFVVGDLYAGSVSERDGDLRALFRALSLSALFGARAYDPAADDLACGLRRGLYFAGVLIHATLLPKPRAVAVFRACARGGYLGADLVLSGVLFAR